MTPTSSPYAADVASIEAIVTASYATISGPSGPRDWARERHLFHPSARLMRGMPAGSAPEPEPTPGLRTMTVDQFIDRAAPRFLEEDFHEEEIGRQVFRFGRWAHVISAYHSARTAGGVPFARGVNSIQLWFDDGRWWIMSILWDWEGDGVAIPAELTAGPRS